MKEFYEVMFLLKKILGVSSGLAFLGVGFYFLKKGLIDKCNLLVEGKGIKVVLTNSSPGIFLSILGFIIIIVDIIID